MAKKYPTDGQNAAFNAGIGYAHGKANTRVTIKDENKDAFRDGVRSVRGNKSQAPDKPRASDEPPHTDADKLKYYAGRVNDKKLTEGQRKWAARQVATFANK